MSLGATPITIEAMAPALPTSELFGVPVSTASLDQILDAIEETIRIGPPSIVVTADSYGLMLTQQDPELAAIYRRASIVTPDSSGVVWALRRKGITLSRVSGVDLVDHICALSAKHGFRIVFIGAGPGVADRAAKNLSAKHAGCQIVWTRDGYFTESDIAQVAAEAASHRPDVLFVAMGIPRQEKFIVQTLGTINAKIAMGVGGSFDVYSGDVKRAPKFIQRLELEWLWRLLLNPKKFYKVAKLPKFAWRVLRGKS